MDDKDLRRSKNTKKLYRLHRMKDKKTRGNLMGQNVVLLYFMAEKFSIHVGFAFYVRDPALKKWKETTKSLKK